MIFKSVDERGDLRPARPHTIAALAAWDGTGAAGRAGLRRVRRGSARPRRKSARSARSPSASTARYSGAMSKFKGIRAQGRDDWKRPLQGAVPRHRQGLGRSSRCGASSRARRARYHAVLSGWRRSISSRGPTGIERVPAESRPSSSTSMPAPSGSPAWSPCCTLMLGFPGRLPAGDAAAARAPTC